MGPVQKNQSTSDRACRLHGLSRRQLSWQLDISTGTVNAYYQGRVDPLHSRLGIQARLARLNGVDLGELLGFYGSDDWSTLPSQQPALIRDRLPDLRIRHGRRMEAVGRSGGKKFVVSPMLEIGLRMLRQSAAKAQGTALEADVGVGVGTVIGAAS